ncbi:MAG TPA: hypothetical protein VGP76_28315 [Planctomycetaceae bacterium]|jgi:hypothetical protein|nr:hypothetical protein [Planctomycetaceae bacterium]
MSLVRTTDRLQLPEKLQAQLYDFRRLVWTIKTIEAVCGAVAGVLVAFLALFILDRLGETPNWERFSLFALTVASCACVPLALHRWVWRNRRLEQLARLLTRKHPHVGDQLLGIIELVRNDFEQARSRALCVAAIQQVAEDAQRRDFRDSVPNPRHRLWTVLALVPLTAAVALVAIFPAAGVNAWARLLAPWRPTPRYTFANVERLPDPVVVAHGEPISLAVHLAEKTVTKPGEGFARVNQQANVVAPLRDGSYAFDLPPQITPAALQLAVGDWRQRVRIEPMARPELTAVTAQVSLPAYLGLPKVQTKDARGGTISPVNGSRVQVQATASRELASSHVNGQQQEPAGSSFASPAVEVKGTSKLQLAWKDRLGLTGKEPFTLAIAGHDDEPPSLVCEGLPRQKVVLDSEMLSFKIHARDDFGVKRVGLEWLGIEDPAITKPTKGERVLAAGGNDKDALDVGGTFSAKSLNIEPQLIRARVFVEDYFPNRKRVYAPASFLYVLSPEQHAIWLTEQLNKWHRQSLEVRDREMQLYETNKQLRALSPQELDRPETRRRIENQAAAEWANGRRLSNLVRQGEDLVQQATRNPEFAIGHLEKWAEMLQILKDIAGNRMPSVADLLKQAAQAPQMGNSGSKKTGLYGQVKSVAESKPGSVAAGDKKQVAVPKVVDQESSQQPPDKKKEGKPAPPKNSQNTHVGLPMTTLQGSGASPKSEPPPPAAAKMDQAIKKQEDLLAEFDKVADELKKVLAELEGSTLVKRLKAASRIQYKVAGRIGDQLNELFGRRRRDLADAQLTALGQIGEQENKEGDKISLIMDDMDAYFDRHRFVKIKQVLDDMRKQDVVGNLRELAGDVKTEKGLTIAQCEYWSDTLDRWAEDLVDPACCGSCACKGKGCLPPALILEVLQILEGEMNLREETRVAEQARRSLSEGDYKVEAGRLSKTQNVLRDRIIKVVAQIRQLPDAETDFGKELHLLDAVQTVMAEARDILGEPNTGKKAIGAETEVIELLLQSKRINPNAGGGSGSNPGGGGGGTTHDSALTLLGTGVNAKEVREDRGVSQATGERGSTLPEEFRAGLDEYFNRLERGASDKASTP